MRYNEVILVTEEWLTCMYLFIESFEVDAIRLAF